jgi:hypothetical protein
MIHPIISARGDGLPQHFASAYPSHFMQSSRKWYFHHFMRKTACTCKDVLAEPSIDKSCVPANSLNTKFLQGFNSYETLTHTTRNFHQHLDMPPTAPPDMETDGLTMKLLALSNFCEGPKATEIQRVIAKLPLAAYQEREAAKREVNIIANRFSGTAR